MQHDIRAALSLFHAYTDVHLFALAVVPQGLPRLSGGCALIQAHAAVAWAAPHPAFRLTRQREHMCFLTAARRADAG